MHQIYWETDVQKLINLILFILVGMHGNNPKLLRMHCIFFAVYINIKEENDRILQTVITRKVNKLSNN